MKKHRYIYRSKVEYADWAFTPYLGCGHGCRYCYCRRMFKVEYKKWLQAKPRKIDFQLLKSELIKAKPEITRLYISFSCDPYQPIENHYKYTRKTVQILNELNIPYCILTKSDLILRDMDVFDSKLALLGLTITTLDEETKRYWEPFSPSMDRRLNALKQLHESGFKTWVSIEPILDYTYLDVIRAVADHVDLIVIGKLNYYKPLKPINWKIVYKQVVKLCNELGVNYIIKKELRIYSE